MAARYWMALSAFSAALLASPAFGQVTFCQSVSGFGDQEIATEVPQIRFTSKGEIKGVTDAPYSAHTITTVVQTLADGTQIRRENKAFEARDSQGRTRSAIYLSAESGRDPNQPSFDSIFDPVDHHWIHLDSRTKTALVSPLWSRPPAQVNQATSVAHKAESTPVQNAIQPKESAHVSTEKLGEQTIDGVLAEGIRTTRVYPAGTIGNNREITATEETWTSPELKIVVLKKVTDPINGDMTMEMQDLDRSEPDPSIFQVPDGYQINTPGQRQNGR